MYILNATVHVAHQICHNRFRYNGFAMARVSAVDIERHQLGERRHESPGNDPTPVPGSEGLHVPEDAVSTMMQWLHGRREAEGTS